MKTAETDSFNALVQQFLGTPLPARLSEACDIARLPAEARAIVVRMLALMRRASCPATELNSHMIWLMSTVTPAMLPSAWGGRIPPLTAAGRHHKLDAYIARRNWPSRNGPAVFVDLGCGFPPATTVDTAAFLTDWCVIGVDQSFADYVLYDAEGNYACFNREGAFVYFQPRATPLHENPKATRKRFESLFASLSPAMPPFDDKASRTIKENGFRLVSNHIRDFETPNLKFIQSGIEDFQSGPARVIRCMNVLLYFPKDVRRKMRKVMGEKLEEDGLLITGFNHPFGSYARYTVRKKSSAGMSPCEFAFSPDNLRPLGVGPWLTIVEGDEEADLLADLTGAIRADRRFWGPFNGSVDALRTELGICTRDENGFIQFTRETREAPPGVVVEKTTTLWHRLEQEGYIDGAIAALKRAGYQAWKNPAGDIAVLPPEGSLPAV